MAQGYHSLLAFWIGGAGTGAAPATPVGYRSLLAPWIGGAGVPSAPPGGDVGYTSLLAFWVGGAGVLTTPADTQLARYYLMRRLEIPSFGIAEKRKVTFPFAMDVPLGVTISSATVTASVYSGTDASPADIISGSATISGTNVVQLIDATAAVLGVLYEVLCTATLSDGQKCSLAGYVAVAPSLP